MQLSTEGVQKVAKVARKLRDQGVRIDMMYTSPLHRAVTTAELLASILHISTTVQLDKLTDVHIPSLAGKPLRLRAEIHKTGIDEYSGKYADAGHETRADIVKRMYAVVQKILREHKGRTVGIVSHGDSLRFLLFQLLCKNKQIPSMGELKTIYYPPKGEGWKMTFDEKGNIRKAQLLPNGEDLAIQY